MRYLGIRQFGLLLGAAGASVMLAGAAHADSTSPAQASDNSSVTNLTVSGDQAVTTQSTTTVTQSSDQTPSGPPPADTPPDQPSVTAPASQTAPALTQPTTIQKPDDKPAAAAAPNPPAAQSAQPAPSLPQSFFAPVTIIRALVPEVVTTQTGQKVISVPRVQPVAPSPEVPSPTGALTSAGLMLGQFILPLFGAFGHFLTASFSGPLPYLEAGLLVSLGLFMSFAYLLRRWGYAISARGSDPRLQLAYEFASPAMSELVPD